MLGIYISNAAIEIGIYISMVVLLLIGYLNESRLIRFEAKIKLKIYRAFCKYEERKILGTKK